MRERLPIVLSASALLVAVFGATPLGHAAGRVIHSVPPFAARAGFAKLAGTADNAKRLAGHRASVSPKAGDIPVLGSSGKLPASIGAVGPQGPQGPKGDPGAKGDKGTDSTTKIVIVRVFGNNATPGQVSQATATCGLGERLIGGGAENISVNALKKPILNSFPTGQAGEAPTGWFVQVLNDDTTGSVAAVARALCASP